MKAGLERSHGCVQGAPPLAGQGPSRVGQARICLVLAVLVLILAASPGPFGSGTALRQVWETPRRLDVPESVMYDEGRGVLYVSNIAGKSDVKDAQGFISRLGLDGRIESLYWVRGLDAPKGMGIAHGTLYVTDIDRVHAIDIATGKIVQTREVAGAKFLNDIAVDVQGRVYISDMQTGKIHLLEQGRVREFITLEQRRPNGLHYRAGTLFVGTAQGLVQIDVRSRETLLIIEHPGGIDGLKPLDGQRFLVSDWKGRLEIIARAQAPVVLLDTTALKVNAADFEYIPEKALVVIPTFSDNRVVAYWMHP